MNGIRITSGTIGIRAAKPRQRRRKAASAAAPASTERVGSVAIAMRHLFGQADAGIDVRVQNVDDQVDKHDHDPGQNDDPLYQGKIALKDALVEQSADAGPSEDNLDGSYRLPG